MNGSVLYKKRVLRLLTPADDMLTITHAPAQDSHESVCHKFIKLRDHINQYYWSALVDLTGSMRDGKWVKCSGEVTRKHSSDTT